MRYFFSVILAIAAALPSYNPALAAPRKKTKAPKGAILLPAGRVFMRRGPDGPVVCGGKKNFEPGKFVGKRKAYFISLRSEISSIRKKGADTRRDRRKLKRLKAELKDSRLVCNAGPPPPDAFNAHTVPLTADDIYHLYRRAGLGPPPAEALGFEGRSAGDLAAYFLSYNPNPVMESSAGVWLDGDPAPPHYPESRITAVGLNLYALAILGDSPNQAHDRFALMALHDRLPASSTSANSSALRPMVLGYLNLLRSTGAIAMNYRGLIEALGEDPLMMRWLNLDSNTKSAPNENYAREMMELFTLDTTDASGALNFTNQDVAAVARAFTGWEVKESGGQWRAELDPAKFDDSPGKIIFKGRAFEGRVASGRDVVRHIFDSHPNAPRSLAIFIASEYLRDDAPPHVIESLAFWIKESDFQLRPVFEKLFSSDEFYKPEYRFAIAKSPVERFVHLMRVMRAVGMPYDLTDVRSGLAGMGCVITQPETVFGCDKLEEIPIGQRLLRSANLVTTLSNDNNLFQSAGWTYAAFLPAPAASAEETILHFERLFGVTVTNDTRAAFLDFMNSAMNSQGTLVRETWNPASAGQVRRKISGLFRLFATLPQFHDLR